MWARPAGNTGALAAGHITRFAGIDFPHYIVTGPDGALWFVNMQDDSIGRITTTGQARTFSAPQMSIPATITVGPDGALWFTNRLGQSIGRITTGGKITIFRERGEPEDIVTGPDHNLWVSNISGPGGPFDSIARLTPSGQFTYFTVPNKDEAWDITNGPGGLWFTDIQGEVGGGGAIGLITAR